MMQIAMPAGVPVAGPGAAFYYDDPGSTPVDQLRSHAAIQIADSCFEPPSGLEIIQVPGGSFAEYLHEGSYDGLGDAWERVISHGIPDAGLEPDGQWFMEEYLNDCNQVAEDELLTKILVSVK